MIGEKASDLVEATTGDANDMPRSFPAESGAGAWTGHDGDDGTAHRSAP